mgnify:FL=1
MSGSGHPDAQAARAHGSDDLRAGVADEDDAARGSVPADSSTVAWASHSTVQYGTDSTAQNNTGQRI